MDSGRRRYGPPTADGETDPYELGDGRVVTPPAGFIRQWPEIPREYLKIAEDLGSGAFGVVKKGYLMRNNKVIECAVKMLKSKCRKRTRCRIFLNIQLSVCNRSRNRQIPGFELNRVHGTNFAVNCHATSMCLLKEPQSTVQIIPLSFDVFFPFFSLAQSPPRDLQITAYK